MAYADQFLSQSMIRIVLDTQALGVYSAVLVFSGLINTIRGGFTTYWSTFIYKFYKTEKEKIQIVHDVVMFVSIILVIFLMLFRDFVFLFLGEKFRDGKSIFIFVIINSILTFAVETTSYGCMIQKKPQIISAVSFFVLILKLVGMYFGGILYGILGIGFSAMISGVVYFGVESFLGQKYYNMVNNPKRTTVAVIILSALGLINCFVTNISLLCSLLGVMSVILCIIYRPLIEIVGTILKKNLGKFKKKTNLY